MITTQNRTGISKMVAIVIIVVVVLIAGFAVFYVSSGSSPSSGANISCESSAAPSSIQISTDSGASNSASGPGYSPDKITLVIGTNNTVTWTNNDAVHHTVTSSAAPAGASFDSGNINQGATYSCTFTTVGTYQYYCKYHSWMTGTILVVS
jgi:plastocyanin